MTLGNAPIWLLGANALAWLGAEVVTLRWLASSDNVRWRRCMTSVVIGSALWIGGSALDTATRKAGGRVYDASGWVELAGVALFIPAVIAFTVFVLRLRTNRKRPITEWAPYIAEQRENLAVLIPMLTIAMSDLGEGLRRAIPLAACSLLFAVILMAVPALISKQGARADRSV
ncbi:MAG TPA: hypothetical protein VGM37_00235 [Armatimonadota bacterium]|jgi:hypothetical protein